MLYCITQEINQLELPVCQLEILDDSYILLSQTLIGCSVLSQTLIGWFILDYDEKATVHFQATAAPLGVPSV